MAPPRKRLVITKNKVHTEYIPRQVQHEVVIGDKTKKNRILKFLSRKASRKQVSNKLQLLRQRKPFTKRPRGSRFRFRRIETLVKKKHTSMKHWNMTRTRGNSKRYLNVLRKRMSKDVAPILFIVRIHGNKNLPIQIQTMLKQLRLNRPFYGVLRRNTPLLQTYLAYLDNYVTYGVPTKELIRDLIMKRGKIMSSSIGYGKPGRHSSRSVIKSNVMIENIFNKTKYKGEIICIEDIIDILSKNPYRIGTNLENEKLKELENKLLKNTVFENNNNNNNNNNINNDDLEMQLIQLANQNRNKLESIMKNNIENNESNINEIENNETENNETEMEMKQLEKNIGKSNTIFDEIKTTEKNQITKFETICDYVNPFELNGMRIPMKGLTGPFDHKGYYGYRGEHINKFVEKLI